MRYLVKILYTVLALALLAGCAARPPARDSVASLPNLENGWSRLYFSSGVIDMPYRPNVEARYNHQIGPVFVDEVNVGSPANGEYIVVDVKAGSHALRWQPQEQAEKLESVVEKVNLSSGQTKYFACDTKVFNVSSYTNLSPAGMAFGALGAAVTQSGEKSAPVEKSARGLLVEKSQFDSSSRLVAYFKYDEVVISKKTTKPNQETTKLDNPERMKQLQKLRKDGSISEQEYQQKRKAILNQI